MASMLFTLGITFAFLGGVLAIWTGMHLLAEKRLGPRKQGCKGPIQGNNGEMLCCKGDGSRCEEHAKTEHPGNTPG